MKQLDRETDGRMKTRKRTKTYYRYASLYFTALFVITALVMTGVLFLSAREMENQATGSLKNSMKQAAEVLEKQYQVMEGIALQIGTKIDYRPYRVAQGGVYDIELLERFRQYTNYSPLSSQYFLVYQDEQKIYTSSGNTSYFDYYAPVNLQIPYELTREVLHRITAASSPFFDHSGGSFLATFPIRFPGVSVSVIRPAFLCFVLTADQIRTYLAQVAAGLPENYGVSIGGAGLIDAGAANGPAELTVYSSRGNAALFARPEFTGWTLLMEKDGYLILAAILISLLLAVLTALTMARFSLRPLDRLIEKYAGEGREGIENEFRELDAILSKMEQSKNGSQFQLKNHLLLLLLRGNYSEKILHRWAMLGVAFDRPLCCVYLIDCALDPQRRLEMGRALEALTDARRRLYTAEMEEETPLVVLANYEDAASQEDITRSITAIAERYQGTVHAGVPVETPKRLPISFMSALTESRLNTHAPQKKPAGADQLAERLIAAVTAGNQTETEQAAEAVRAFLSDEPITGVLARYQPYELASSILRKAENRGISLDRTALNALVLLPDPALAAEDLTGFLREAVSAGTAARAEADETARLIVEYVIANACDPDLNLQTMSETFGLSPDYISSMIKRETGSAFKEYVTMLRISEAQRLFNEDKSLTVSEVSAMVGYRKASNFSKKYKELTGILPSQSR